MRSFGSSNPALKWRRAALRFNIEWIVPKEIEDRSPKEFGRLDEADRKLNLIKDLQD